MAIFGSLGNFPFPPMKRLSYKSFPNDLISEERDFYTELTFMSYNVRQQLTSSALMLPLGGVRLPIPRKINDVQTLVWSAESGLSSATSIASSFAPKATAIGGAIAAVGGAVAGMSLNPLLFMTFQKPNYKEHNLSWSFIPSTEQESNTIVDIVNYLKFNSLPKQSFGGVVYEYPNILAVKLFPDDTFTMRFRPCAVLGVQVDYTGAGTPSFFKNGAPTVVNLTLQLQEIQLWDQTNYQGQEGVSISLDGIAGGIEKVRTTVRDTIRDALNRL
jgi:hypothetical protein